MSFFVELGELGDREGNFLASVGPLTMLEALAISSECAADGMYTRIRVELEE